jgi:polyketide synthase-like dehydratase family protein/polyketide synthase family protein
MAARAGTRALLQASGQKFLSPTEGADQFLREIAARNPEPEVTITGPLPELDLDGLLARDESLRTWQSLQSAGSRLPMVDAVLEHSNDRTVIETRLDAGRDPFLLEHRIGPMPILPAVVAVEVLAETATIAAGRQPAAIEGVVIETALKLAAGRRLAIRCSGTTGSAGALDLALRTDFVGRGGQLIDPDRSLVHGHARFDAEPIATPARVSMEGQRVAFAYPQTWENDPKATRVYHGPPLRGLTEVIIGRDGWHEARITAPVAEGLRPDRLSARWWLPAAILDCCLQACGVIARAKLAAMALPGSFGRIRVGRHPGASERCRAMIHKLGHEERRIHFDIILLGENGDVLLSVEDYVAHTFAPIGAPSASSGEMPADGSDFERASLGSEPANGSSARHTELRRPIGATSGSRSGRQV